MATDAFGRLRISEPYTTFNYYPTPLSSSTNDNDVWVTDTSGGANVLYNSSSKAIELSIFSGNQSATKTTKLPMEYQPGKSRQIMMSTAMITPVPSESTPIYSRIGLFNIDSSSNPTTITDGVWFEVDCSNLTMNWCETVNNNGVSTSYKIPDSSWNIDTFNGSGPSGKTLTFNDMSKCLLIIIDQEWLGVGRLRCGFNIDGITYYAHAFSHSQLSNAYTGSPRQRLGYQMFSDGSIGLTYKMKQICSTCMSEGGFLPLGVRNSISTDASGVTISQSASPKVILALKIRTGSDYKNGIIKIINLDLTFRSGNANSTDNMKYTVQLHSTNGNIGSINNTPNYSSVDTKTISTYADNLSSSNTTISTTGYILTSGFITSNTSVDFASNDYETLLTRTNLSQYDTLYVTAESSLASGTVYGALDFIESL